jgi:hypothetical protein
MMSLCHKHEPPNIQMQRTGLYIMLLGIRNLPAADLGRSKDRALFDAQPCGSQRMVVIRRKSHEPDLSRHADAPCRAASADHAPPSAAGMHHRNSAGCRMIIGV